MHEKIRLEDLPTNQDGSRSLSTLDQNEELIISGPSKSSNSISFRRQRTIPLPDLGLTPVNWTRIDKVSKFLCPCTSFITSSILVATTGSILFGFNTALLNTSVSYIAANFSWCDLPGDVAVFIGAAGGAITAGRFSDNGPRLVLLASLVVFFVGIVSSIVANHFSSILWARLIVGFSVGVTSVTTPTYISEVSPPDRRGAFGVIHQFVLASGQLLANALGLAFIDLPTRQSGNVTSDQATYVLPKFNKIWWRVMLGLGLIPVLIALSLFGPVYTFETPHYYVRKKDDKNATLLLQRIYNKTEIDSELQSLKDQIFDPCSTPEKPAEPVELVEPASFFTLLKKPGYNTAFLVGLTISALQQLTGINAFIASSNKLFADSGLTGRYITLASMGLTGINVLCCGIPFFVIEKLGRRTLLLFGACGMALSVLPATILYLIEWNKSEISTTLTALSITGACAFVVFFALAAGPITWIYIFEIFPMEIKATASSICVAVNWIASILMVFCAAYLSAKINYTIFTIFSIINIFFLWFCVKETKGRAMGDSPFVPNNQILP